MKTFPQGRASWQASPESWVRLRVMCWLAISLVLSPYDLTTVAMAAEPAPIIWSDQINLSNTPQSSGRPAIVSDAYGLVHVFWSEDVGGEPLPQKPLTLIRNGNTIFYTRWDGTAWTEPVDILFVPEETVAEYVAVTVDAANYLHIVWTGQTNFYHSAAPSWLAHSAQAWSTPSVIAAGSARTQWESDIAVDAGGGVHVIYATGDDEQGIFHALSEDGGATWRTTALISAPLRAPEVSFSNVRMVIDESGRLHVVWQTNQIEGYGQAAYYARSLDGGQTWSVPFQMGWRSPTDYGVSFPFLTALGESELHVIYVGGSWHIGRYHRISRDGGETWSEAEHIMTEMEGVNGYIYPLVDGKGGMHLIMTMRTRSQVGGLFYARWLGAAWSPVEPIAIEPLIVSGAHWTAATMRLGNEIHIVWNSNFSSDAGEIGYIRGRIAGVSPAPALPTPPPDTPTPAPTPTLPAPQPTTVPVPTAPTPYVNLPTSLATTSLTDPLLVGVGAALLVVAGVVFLSVLTRSR